MSLCLPLCQILAGAVECPLADLMDQAGILGHGDEFTGLDVTPFFIVPMYESLGADDAVQPQIDDGLINQM